MKKQLSPTGLNLYRECPRCFYIKNRADVDRPRGLFPSLPGGIDRVLKAKLNQYREMETMPGFLKALEPLRLAKIGMNIGHTEDGWRLYGKLDDCLIGPDGLFTPLDHKTRGSVPQEDAPHPAYQFQMDCYAYLLDRTGRKLSGEGVLVYYTPKEAGEFDGSIPFDMTIKRFPVDPSRAEKVIRAAAACLEADVIPGDGGECEYCRFVAARGTVGEPLPLGA